MWHGRSDCRYEGYAIGAGINGDKRDAVFISLRASDVRPPEPDGSGGGGWERPTKRTFSYLVMRYLPSGSSTVRTVILGDASWVKHAALGFCGLDGDGWVEVVSEDTMMDYEQTRLHHWTGTAFRAIEGRGADAEGGDCVRGGPGSGASPLRGRGSSAPASNKAAT